MYGYPEQFIPLPEIGARPTARRCRTAGAGPAPVTAMTAWEVSA